MFKGTKVGKEGVSGGAFGNVQVGVVNASEQTSRQFLQKVEGGGNNTTSKVKSRHGNVVSYEGVSSSAFGSTYVPKWSGNRYEYDINIDNLDIIFL
jgi:hypothetical protein